MKKKLIAVMIMGALAFSLAACGSQPSNNDRDEKEEREETDDREDEEDENDKDSNEDSEMSSDIVISVDGDEWKDVRAAYSELIKNMKDYVAGCERLNEEYITYDYMYFDYDEDEENEVILYLGYNTEDGDYMRDVVFMDYFEERHEVGILAISHAELNDKSFYAEYDSKLARYSWVDVNESYLYVVNVRDGSLSFVLEEGYDYLISDIEAAGMHPLPLYGDWEIILPED